MNDETKWFLLVLIAIAISALAPLHPQQQNENLHALKGAHANHLERRAERDAGRLEKSSASASDLGLCADDAEDVERRRDAVSELHGVRHDRVGLDVGERELEQGGVPRNGLGERDGRRLRKKAKVGSLCIEKRQRREIFL